MPRANPNTSFEVATKHLFRHIHEPDRLRENPLTRCFFETTGAPESARVADRAALERIHGLLRVEAASCRDEDRAAGNGERARRQYAIAIEGCLEGKAVRTVARALGISSTQYYRERAGISARLARYIRDAGDPRAEATAAPFDDFRYAMVRAASIAELGDPGRAIEEYGRLFDSTNSASQRIEVLCETSLAYSRDGAGEDVERPLQQARTLLDQTITLSTRERRIAEAHVNFVRGMSTWPTDPTSALQLFETAISILEQLAHPSDRTRELHARILFEFGEGLAAFQGLRKSVETLSAAAKILATCREPSPHLSLRIEITLRVFRNSMLVDPFGWEPLHQRLRAMLELGERARLTGSVDLNLRALNAISQLHACSGDAVAARLAVQSALALSKYHPTKELFSEVSLRMARTLMYTPLWREVPSVLRIAGVPATVSVAASRKTLEAEFALRRGMYAQVSDALCEPEISRRPYMAMLAAQAADGLGRRREALALIEPAMPEIERSGIALTIERTYRIAGQITNDRRYCRKADEVERATGV